MTTWEWRTFAELTPYQLYDVLQLRELVFTIGQKATDPDLDDVDKKALHLLGYADGKLTAYLRVYKKHQQQHIGRVVVHPDSQGKSIGREMMLVALQQLREHFPDGVIAMSAQLYLQKFYESLGFVAEGDVYREAGIEHVRMVFPQSRDHSGITSHCRNLR